MQSNCRIEVRTNKPKPLFIKKNQYLVIYDIDKKDVQKWTEKYVFKNGRLLDRTAFSVICLSGMWPPNAACALKANRDIYFKETSNNAK